jgi:hypothetical protein
MPATPKLVDSEFVNGQQSYARGVGLRTIVEQVSVLMDSEKDGDEAKGMSLLFGYLDGVTASIRRIDNLMMFPAGPDR